MGDEEGLKRVSLKGKSRAEKKKEPERRGGGSREG